MKLRQYLPLYEEIYPQPPKPKLQLDWQFYIVVIVSIAAIVLAASRTAHSFFDAAVLSAQLYGAENFFGGTFPYLEAIAAMLAVEGGLVLVSMKRAQHVGKIPPKIYSRYLMVLLFISIVAGVGQSLGLIIGLEGIVLTVFTWIMALTLGIGATVIALFSGELLGVELIKFRNAQGESDKLFERRSKKWLDDARKHWYENGKNEPAPVEPVASEEEKPAEQADTPPHEVHRRKVRAYLGKIVMQEGRIPPAGEIGRAVGLSEQFVLRMLDGLKEESLKNTWK